MKTVNVKKCLTVVFLWFSMVLLLCAQNGTQTSYPTKWEVNCNGYIGILDYTVDLSTDKITGTLLGTKVEGYIVDRHLILHRYPEGRTQIWDGWIMDRTLGAPGNLTTTSNTL